MIFLSVIITEAQLLISGLLSGIAVVGLVVKWVITSPEREAAAYKAGVVDEQARCQEDIQELRTHALDQGNEITKLRNALLRLAIAADLTATQRYEIAQALGYPETTKLQVEVEQPLPGKDGDE